MSSRSKHKTRMKQRGRSHSIRVHRTNKHIYVQLAGPDGVVITGISTKTSEVAKACDGKFSNISAATQLGVQAAVLVKALKVDHWAFDRCGHVYHGRVKAVAEALRQQGVKI